MLTSKKIELRRSEIRQSLAELANIETPSEDEVRKMGELDAEYRAKETQYRAALIAEDEERREAGAELETRSETEWADMMAGFEVRQVVMQLEEGRDLDGQTAEIVQEMRAQGGYRGTPVPFEALDTRATVSTGTPDPMQTMPIIDRLFAESVSGRMGVAAINIAQGEREYPVVSSSISAGWAATEGGNVADPQQFTTVDKSLAPDNTFGVQMRITRKAMKQSGAGLETAIRRDMAGAIRVGMDQAVFLGSGTGGEPLGIIPGAATYGITETAIGAAASYAAFRSAATRFMTANAANSLGGINLLIRPELFDAMDADLLTGTAVSEWDRLTGKIGNVVLSPNALEAPTGSPAASTGVMTTSAGGLPPAFLSTWGGIDVIRDQYTDAQSGGLRLTGLVTADVTVARGTQLEILTGLEG